MSHAVAAVAVPRTRLERALGLGKDAGLLIVVMLAVPLVVLALGLPVAWAVRAVLALSGVD